jgi:hypothetical protein
MKKKAAVLMVMVILFVSAMAIGLSEPTEAPEEKDQYTPEELLSIWYQIGSMLKEYGSYPYVELERGDKGYEVRLLQIRLAELSYYFKAIDDKFGSGTYAGMRQFERMNGLHVDGIASANDQRLLFSSSAQSNTGSSGYTDYTEDSGDAEDAEDVPDEEDEGDDGFLPDPMPHLTIDPDVFRTLRPLEPVVPIPTPKSTIDLSDMFDRFRHK